MESEVFSITCGRKPKITVPKPPKKDKFLDIPLCFITNMLASNQSIKVSREWAISVGLLLQENDKNSNKPVDIKKETPTVSIYDFDNDDELP